MQNDETFNYIFNMNNINDTGKHDWNIDAVHLALIFIVLSKPAIRYALVTKEFILLYVVSQL